jgi:ATP-binding protein involved in chromosome partitioning
MSKAVEPANQAEIPDPARAARKVRLQHNLDDIRHKLVVMSGKGGVGKSTVAAYLALGLAARGYRVGLMDVDLHGPSIPRLLGIKGEALAAADPELIMPVNYSSRLSLISIEVLMHEKDASVIWRGPMKMKAIKQFLADVCWGELDYLVIDSPPGTGDEPLSVAQTIPGARAVIVTTPQEIALADVRKSIDFCRHLEMPILGLIENFAGLVCPKCGELIHPFGSGGGNATAQRYHLEFLGSLPMDMRLVEAGDQGRPLDLGNETKGAGPGYRAFIDKVLASTNAQPEGVH